MLERLLLINSVFIGDCLSVLNSSVRGFCLLTESKPWQGQKTLPNYKYCSLFSGGVLLTFALQFKKGKKKIFQSKYSCIHPLKPKRYFFFFYKPRGHRIWNDIINQQNKQTSDKWKKLLKVNEADFNGEHFILEIKV